MLSYSLRTAFVLTLSYLCMSCQAQHQSDNNRPFTWDNATVYFVYVDRFFNGDSANDVNYGRVNDYQSETKNVATFHGGDIKGLTDKLEQGYFTELGINVLWITGVYEQIHGWVGGGNSNDFPHYAYHGYYPMDFTMMDKNFGTIEEFRRFIDLAHEQGIRVMMDAGINHPGYSTLLDAAQYKFGGVELTPEQAVKHEDGLAVAEGEDVAHYNAYRYLQHFDMADQQAWANWWGEDWIRNQDEVDKDVLTESIFGLPDFRSESLAEVALPPLMKHKWTQEGAAFDPWVNPSAVKYRTDLPMSQSDYVIKWLVSWVEEFGIDGFRCDVLDNVDTFRWKQLKQEADQALATWRSDNPDKAASEWKDDFWLTGDIWDAGIEEYPQYAEAGFASIVNFTFPKDGDLSNIGKLWQEYADYLNTKPHWTTLSFLNNTYKRDTRPQDAMDNAIALLLSPGAVQVFYGDEVARKKTGQETSDPTHGYRGDFVWGQNPEVLAHWQKIGKFRQAHPAVGAGLQKTLAPGVFLRELDDQSTKDAVIIALSDLTTMTVKVESVFAEGSKVRNAYTGEETLVANGQVTFKVLNKVLLLESA